MTDVLVWKGSAPHASHDASSCRSVSICLVFSRLWLSFHFSFLHVGVFFAVGWTPPGFSLCRPLAD